MSFIGVAITYAILVGGLQLVASLAWLAVAAGLIVTRGSRWYCGHIERVALFNGLLFGWGIVLNTCCQVATSGRWYVSHDSFVDWQPFIPFGQWVLDQRLGDQTGELLGGASLTQLRTLWWVAAAATWGGAALCFVRLRRRISVATF